MKQPIFSANEVAKFSNNRRAYLVVLVIMLAFETFLYSMIKKILIPKDMLDLYPGIEFAVVVMVSSKSLRGLEVFGLDDQYR